MKSKEEDAKREALPQAYFCPFRKEHYCKTCELFDINLKACIFKAININLGRLVTGNPDLGKEEIAKREKIVDETQKKK